MQWGQIKTLFILCFLLLDIYLLTLVIQKIGNDDLNTSVDTGQLADLDQLELENISVPNNLPETLPDDMYITVRKKVFSEEELEEITARDGQEIEVVNNSFIISLMDESLAIPENATKEVIEQIISGTVYLGNEYSFEYWDKERNILVFFQRSNNRPVYYNRDGLVLVYLDEANEMLGYTQTILGEPETINEEKSVIPPLRAIMRLYQSNILRPNDKVIDYEMGYYSMFPPVLIPTWKIIIEDKQDRFVNAIERFVIPVNDEFMEDVLNLNIENTRIIKGNEEFKVKMLEILEKFINNRSESS